MRRILCLLWLLLFWGSYTPLCAAWRADSGQPVPTRSPLVTLEKIRVTHPGGEALNLHLLRWERRAATLGVVDLSAGQSVAAGLAGAGALAGVNGGYFHPDRRPLGLVVADGKVLHRQERAKLLSGLLIVTPARASLLRTGEFKSSTTPRQALQAGPFLVDAGRAVGGLNATRAANRTVILADRNGAAALLTTDAVTLARLGEILATPGLLPGLKVERALNLDGGSSTALWADAPGRPYSRPEWKEVRNALGVFPRSPAPTPAKKR